MSATFAAIVEEVKTLTTQEKHELHELLEKYLVEERREEIYENYVDGLSELDKCRSHFTSDMNDLKGRLLDD